MSLNVIHRQTLEIKLQILVKAFFFSKSKCLSKDLFIAPMDIVYAALVAACKLRKKFYYKNVIITPETANRIRHNISS